MVQPTILIPVTFPDPEIYPVTETNVDVLDGFNIVLFGYWVHPEERTAAETRTAHETDARAVLYEIAAEFSHAGARTDIQLHFGPGGPEKQDLQKRIVAETDSDGVLFAHQLPTLNNIFLPLRDSRHRETIVRFVGAFDTESVFVVELYHAVADEGAIESAREMLGTVADSLLEQGFSESDLEVTVEVVEDVNAGIAAKARNHNLVVMGETERADADDAVYGAIGNYVIDETETPVVVVR